MTRLFKRYNKRKSYNLDGMWKFKTDPEGKGVEEKWFDNFPKDCSDMIIPSCWNNELGLYDYEGLAWYTTTFETSSDTIRLIFNGVTGQAEVYLDGEHIGSHYGGFTGFDFVIKDLSPGAHNLTISVDNTHDSINTIPLSRVDWFHYGGITRSVEVEELKDVWIKEYKIDYTIEDNYKNASVDFNITLGSLKKEAQNRILNVYVNDDKIHTCSVKIEGEIKLDVKDKILKDILLWSTENPNLYNVRFEIEDDDIIERVGFREIKLSDKKLLLNGQQVKIKGVNRHEEHPDWGFAIPLKLMKKDIDIIKNLGCNAIRGSHYPNAEIFLDYCDQEGILFWEEIPMWGFPEEPIKNPVILERGLMMHEEMVKRDYHHPCIIIWGMHNEIDTRIQSAYELTKSFVDKVRSIDKTRLISYATMFPLDDICYSLVDIVSVNKYLGWYGESLEEWIVFLKSLKKKLLDEKLGQMPIIMSEFGAGAIYGDSTFEGPKWTENYQEKYLDYTLKLFLNDSDIIGTYIWQYCDIRTAKEMEMGRPRSFNNKGIVNEYRKPKLAYWTVQNIYQNII